MSVKEVSPDLLADAGLSEKEIQVYLTILGLGNATLGQVSQITGIDIFETQELLAQLENLHYVKKLPGILSRYIPMEPFLKAFVDIDKRFQIDMAQLKDALSKDVADFTTNLDNTYGNLSQVFDLARDRFKTPQIISDTEENLNRLFSEQKNHYISVKDKGTEILKQSIADLSNKLMKEVGERQGLVGQLTLGAIDVAKTSIETSRQTLSTLTTDLSSNLQRAVEELKSNLFSNLEQHVDSHDNLTQTILQEVDRLVEKYQTEFARSSTYLKEDFTRLVDNQDEAIAKNHETLQSSLRDVFEEIARDWNRTTNDVQPELDQVNTTLSEFGQRLNALGEEIRTFQTGFRKPFPQEEMAAKTETLATELDTVINETKTLIDKLNTPIEAALSGSQTMTQKTEELISEITTKTKEELENLKKDAEERISGTLRDFKADLVGENQEKLAEYFSNIKKVVIDSKERVDSDLTAGLQTQTGSLQQFLPKADTQHNGAANQVEQGLTRVRKEVETLLTEHGGAIQTLFQEKQTELATSWGDRVEEFHTQTDKCNSEIMTQLKGHFEAQTAALETVVDELRGALEPVFTRAKELANEMEREVGEKVVAVTMRTVAAERAISKVQAESSQIRPVITAKTWALLGKQNLPPLVNDMLTRTKSSITLVLPELSGQLLNRISELPQTRKITLVSEIDIDHYERELGQLLDQGNVQLRHYDKKDINMCIRDAEEAFLALETPEEEFVTILTESEQLVQLLYKIMSSEFVSIAKPVRF